MRIAFLKMQSKNRGGLEKYASRIATAFVKRGDDVTLLTNGIPEQENLGIDYCPFPICRWPGFLKLEQYDRCVRGWLKKNRADLVFGMERNRIQTHIRAGNGVHAAFLKSRIESEGWFKYGLCQINPLHRKLLELEKAAFEYPGLKKIFVNSRMVQNDLLNFYAVDSSKIEVVHNGVEWIEHELPFSGWEKARNPFLESRALSKDVLHLLFIGNGYRRKGLDELMEALSIWEKRDFHLSVIGKEKNIDGYRNRAEQLGLKGHITFFGPQKEVISFYQMADALVIPSFYDPFANVTVEALSFGLFVVSSKSNGGSEILEEVNGTVIETLKPESITDALEKAHKKTASSARAIRASVSHLDFGNQLSKLIDGCI